MSSQDIRINNSFATCNIVPGFTGNLNVAPDSTSTVNIGGASSTINIGGSPYSAGSTLSVDTAPKVSSFTATWDTIYASVVNAASTIVITLPSATAGDVGSSIRFWVTGDTSSVNIEITAPSAAELINNVQGETGFPAKMVYDQSRTKYTEIVVWCTQANVYRCDTYDSLYTQIRYRMRFDLSTNVSTPSVFLNYSGTPPSTFMTSANDWWTACKVEVPLFNDSQSRALWATNNFGYGYRGTGTHLAVAGNFLIATSPTTIIGTGEWLIVQYDTSADTFTVYINGVKVIDAAANPYLASNWSTPATSFYFGAEPATSNGTQGLRDAGFSCVAGGSGLLTDIEAALFTTGMYDPDALALSVASVDVQTTFGPGITDINADVGNTASFTAGTSDIFVEQIPV